MALKINPELKIIASPWSPPGWMKTEESMIGGKGGSLKVECYQVYADYFVKFIKAYINEGLPIYAVTIQNEPNYAPSSYAGMKMSPEEESLFIASYLGPTLEREGLNVKIFCYDHNWDRVDLPLETLNNKNANKYIAGSAWHYYGGEAGSMGIVKEQFPQKSIWFTEGSTGKWIGQGAFNPTLLHGMNMAIDIFNNWSETLIWWNIALDEFNGPIVFDNSANLGLLTVDRSNKTIRKPYNSSWYTLGHFSKFIKRGAVKIYSEDLKGQLKSSAFKNPDGTIVLVLFNRFFSDFETTINWKGYHFNITIPANSVITCVW